MDESKQILIVLSRLEENVKNMNTKVDGFNKISDLALQTEQSAKSAHNRIDDIKKDQEEKLRNLKEDYEEKLRNQKEDYEDKIRDQKENLQELKGHITWLWRTVGAGAITLVFGVILFYIQQHGGS